MDTLNVININGENYNMSSPTSDEYKKLYIESFGDEYIIEEKNSLGFNVTSHSVDGYFFELSSNITNPFKVQIFDEKENLMYSTELSSGMYTKLNRKYYTKWKTRLYLEDLVFEHEFNLENSRVFIVFESSSLGDTIAWMPYCEEFRKKHNCHVIVSSFRNDMFKNLYPEIEFVERGAVVPNLKALYRLGWFYDKDKEPVLPSTIPLQKSATNILGLDYEEIHSRIYFEPKERPYPEKYICIAPSSTAGCKLWNNPTGWLELTKYLLNKGYKIINISKDGEQIEGVENISDDSMENTKNVIFHSEFVIGLSSGLSWLSWALGKHVVMISNFTEPDHEFTINCTRITNPLVCNGCWNNPKFKFDKGDWYWCPEHKGTERQFECHKSITADMVINQIQHLLL
jgi:autotransporter strand-loop-strand O-heptosyltransferase